MAYEQGYAGDPRGREAAVEARQGRDDFSFEDKKADAQIGGYYSFERDVGRVWNPGPNPFKKASPEESYSAKPIAKPAAQPIAKPDFSPAAPLIAPKQAPTKTTFYLDESPAFVEQKSETVFHMDKILRDQGFKDKKEVDKAAAFTPAQRKDWQAQHDKTLGAGKAYAKQKTIRLEKMKAQVWEKTDEMMAKHVGDWPGFTQQEHKTIRDVVRHGIATFKHGILNMTAYETFISGQELSDYTNNYAANKFKQTLSPNQSLNDEWTKAVIQEKLSPGSTGLVINWSASTEDDLTAGGWWANLWEAYKKGGILGQTEVLEDLPANFGGAGGMITQAEGGGG